MNLIEQVEAFAANAHLGQFRRDGVTPYIEHPRKVASFFTAGSELWVVAMLHDTLEDTPTTVEDIKAAFDERIAWFVEWLTHDKQETYMDYIRRIARSEAATKVKIADIFANLSDAPTDKQKRKYEKALKILLDQ